MLRWRFIRRLTALLAVVCLMGSWAELMIPDVHDSNVSVVTQSAPIDGAADGQRAPISGVASHHPSAPSGSSHMFHVDHCVHGHFVVMRVVVPLAPRHAMPSWHLSTLQTEPGSVDLPPHSRPPIA